LGITAVIFGIPFREKLFRMSAKVSKTFFLVLETIILYRIVKLHHQSYSLRGLYVEGQTLAINKVLTYTYAP